MSKLVLLVEDINDRTLTTPIDILNQSYKETGRYVEQWLLQEKHEMGTLVKNHIEFQNINQIENFDPNTRYAYYVPLNLFFEMPPLNLFQIISERTMQKLLHNNITLLISFQLDMFDPCVANHFVNKFFDWQRYHMWSGLHNNKTLFLTGCRLDPGFIDWLESNLPNYKFLYSPLLFHWAKPGLMRNNIDKIGLLNTYLSNPNKKLYTHLNKSGRIHRYTLLHGLQMRGLIEDSITSNVHANSLQPDQFTEIISHEDYHRFRSGMPTSYASEFLTDISKNPVPEMLLDVDQTSQHAYVNWNYDPRWFSDTCFDIVGETGSYYDKTQWIQFMILSEKICKTMYNFKPFLINGGPGSLKTLREFGFETWPELFDESYDDEQNMIQRQRIIVENVERWKNNKTEFMSRVRDLRWKLLHNHNHFVNFDAERKLYDTLIAHV